jgi:hypothetical protein
MMTQLVPYSQHFIFFLTLEWAQYVRVFVPGNPFLPNKCNSQAYILPYIKENAVLWIWPLICCPYLNVKKIDKGIVHKGKILSPSLN